MCLSSMLGMWVWILVLWYGDRWLISLCCSGSVCGLVLIMFIFGGGGICCFGFL